MSRPPSLLVPASREMSTCASSSASKEVRTHMRDIGPCHTSEIARRAHSRPSPHSLAENNLTNYGRDVSGVIALAAALKDCQIVNLK